MIDLEPGPLSAGVTRDPRNSVSAIVVTYWTGSSFGECLDALRQQDGLLEVIVVDNGNDAATRAWLRDLAAAEQFLAGLRDHTEPVYEYRPASGYPQAFPTRHGYVLWTPPLWEPYVTDEKVFVNPQRADAEKRVLDYQTFVNNYRLELESIDHRLIDLRAKLTQSEAALAKEAENLK